MATQLNWGKLVSQGRAKAPGVSWTNEEGIAIARIAKSQNKTMAEIAPYIREGILTVEGYLKAKDKPGIVNPLLKLSKNDLLKKVRELDLPVSPDATKETMVDVVSKEEKKAKPVVAPKKKVVIKKIVPKAKPAKK